MKELKKSQGCSTGLWRRIAKGEKLPRTTSSKKTSKKQLDCKYKVAVYIRLSPSDEIREEGSLVNHPQRIKNFVKMKNMSDPKWGKIIETYTDKDLSGKNMNRPAFKKMCRDIVSGKVNAVIVTELSRLSRNVKDFCQFWDFLKEHKIKFFSLKENFDTSTAMGELMVIQAISFAQFERQTTIERIKHGVQARAERGLTNGGQRLLGYDPNPNKKCHFIVNKKEKPIVELIFKKFLELGSLNRVLNFLNENKYTTKTYFNKKKEKKGGNRWTMGTLYTLLTNLAYLGKRELNKRNRNKDQSQLSSSEKYKIYKGHWSAIISQELFDDVQYLLEKNKRDFNGGKHCYILSGLAYCGVCGEKIVGAVSNGRNKKYYYYGHKRKMLAHGTRHLEKCEFENIPAHSLEEAVFFRIKNLVKDRKLLLELAQSNTSENKKSMEQYKSLMQSRIEELKNVEKDIEGLTMAIARTKNPQTQDMLLEKMDAFNEKAQALKEEIEEIKNQKSQMKDGLILAENIFSAMKLINKELPKLTRPQQKQLFSNFIKRVVVYKDKLAMEYIGQEPLGVDSVKSLSSVRLGRGSRIRTCDPLLPKQMR